MASAADQSSATCPASELSADQPFQVDVWDLNLDHPKDLTTRYMSTLDDNEIARARSFRNPRDGERFGAAHGMVREILAGYMGLPPASLEYRTNAFGKPELADGTGRLAFNLSRSGGRALLAVTRGEDVGVDLEMVHADRDGLAIAEQFFSPDERACLLATAPELRGQVFLRCWTLKEAYIKAVGRGLSLGLGTFDVSPLLQTPHNVKQIVHHLEECLNRFGYILEVGSSYFAALVLTRDDAQISLRAFASGITPFRAFTHP
jgi:4'-phosphopantetheinyl transferase